MASAISKPPALVRDGQLSPLRPRIGIVFDLAEENWHSMELTASMLEQNLHDTCPNFMVSRLQPPLRRRFTKIDAPSGKLALNLDRIVNRFIDYPRWLKKRSAEFDLFHVTDHSYAQLVHTLPERRTVVSCHDIDTFECLLPSSPRKRNPLFRAMTKRIKNGLQKAAHITCVSAATKQALIDHNLAPGVPLSVVPNGVSQEYFSTPSPQDEGEAARLLGPTHSLDILHVGSTVPRKRIDLLLTILAKLRESFPAARLIRVGGPLTPEQTALGRNLNVLDSVKTLPKIAPGVLNAVYRRSNLTVLPSEREGFGLPLTESMACGTPVAASDIPAFREVGGPAPVYCPVGDTEAWARALASLLNERTNNPERWSERRAISVSRAAEFTWVAYAQRMARIYVEVLAESGNDTRSNRLRHERM